MAKQTDDFDTETLDGMARAFFATAWSDQCDDAEQRASLSGQDIMDLIPDEIDSEAMSAARSLYRRIEAANGERMEQILETVERMSDGDRDFSPDLFGHYCTMQAMGHGVGLWDAFGNAVSNAIKVPYYEFSSHDLSRNYFED